MTWFKVDDTAHSHPRVVKAGNAAFGLWTRCGAYSAMHLTDGVVPGSIAAMYGTAPQIKKLVAVGLWHARGHTCGRCPQPPEGDYLMHDYHVYNPSRKAVAAGREKEAEKKRRQREAQKGDANRDRIEDESSPNRPRIEDESKTNHLPLFGEVASQQGVSLGDSQGPRARASRPDPSRPQVPPDGGTSSPPPPSSHPAAEDEDEDALRTIQPLIDEMTRGGMRVTWQMDAADWLDLARLVRTHSAPVLAEHAARVWAAAKVTPYSAKYFLTAWRGLRETPPGKAPALRAVADTSRPATKTDAYLAGMARIAEELRAQGDTA